MGFIGQWLRIHGARISPLLFLALLPFLFFWRETLGLLTLGDQDAVFWFAPAYQQVVEQVRSFHLPLWNPNVFSGMPLFGAWQAGVLDPLNWVYLVLGVSSRTLTFVQQLSFSIAAVSTFAYTRSLGMSRRASVIAGVIFAFSGFLVARTLYPGLLHTTALMPLVLFLVERVFQRARDGGGWRLSAIGAFVIAWQVFAAHPQPLVYSSLLVAAYAVYRAATGPMERDARRRFLAQIVLVFVGGALVASVQLLPAFEFSRESVRQEWSYEMFTLHSLHPISLAGTLIPFFHGGGRGVYELPFWGGYWHHNEAQVYLGALAISLAIAGVVSAWRARFHPGMFWAGAGVVGVLLALGKYWAPFAWLLYRVPLLNSFRSSNRWWMIVAMAVAVLAGYFVDRVLYFEAKQRVAIIVAGSCFVVVSSVAVFLTFSKVTAETLIRSFAEFGSLPAGFLSAAGVEFWMPMIAAAAALVAIIVFTVSKRPGRWYALVLVVLVLDFNLYTAFAAINRPGRLEDELGRALPPSMGTPVVGSDTGLGGPHRSHLVINPAAGEFSPLLFYGHEMASGYDPLLNARYKRFSGIDEAGRNHLPSLLSPNDRTLDLLNVRYILIAPTILDGSKGETSIDRAYREQLSEAGRWKKLEVRSPVEAYREFTFFENLNWMPRVWLVSRVAKISDEEQLHLIRGEVADRRFDPRGLGLLGPEDSSVLYDSREHPSSEESLGTIAIYKRSPGRLIVDVDATRPAMAVFSEMFDSGWKARVDGQETAILRVNYALSGIVIAHGPHRLEMTYEPSSVWVGAVISFSAFFALIGLLRFSR